METPYGTAAGVSGPYRALSAKFPRVSKGKTEK